MPPRKRKQVSGSGDGSSEDGPSSKKTKASPLGIYWRWEADGGKWTFYSDNHQKLITDAYNKKKNEVLLDIGGGAKMKIIFDKSVQKNKTTGWERRLSCCLKPSSETDFYQWEWEDEKGKWNPYGVSTCMQLQEAQMEGTDTVDFELFRRDYTVDINKMEQTNNDTSVVRKVRREKATLPKSAEEFYITSGVKEEKEEEEEEPAPSKTKSAARGSGSGRGKSKGSKIKEEIPAESTVKTVVLKGKAPVDPECSAKLGVAHVFSEGNDIYDCMLNQTNLQHNNNKYYICQILKDDNKKAYSVWFRWGRVGKKGQCSLVPCGPDLEEAKDVFFKKFADKTKNDWASRKKFVKVAGKYDMVDIDYTAGGSGDQTDGAEPSTAPKAKVPDSKLDKKLQVLINLICDVKSMEDAVIEMKYDAKKAPLGKLTPGQIKAGYAALKEIDQLIEKKTFGSALIQACNDFYTRIPHDFGMRQPPVIRSVNEVKAKLALLEALSDIEIAMKILKHSQADENPVDTHYKDLKCKMTSLDHTDSDFQMIEDYVQNTHAKTHNQYKMKVLDVFEMDKEGEEENFNDVGNRKLLWHGSRLTNWVGILSKGLRIAPPEAPVTGYMFGKGVYFADMSSKSANYCFASKSKNVGLVLLSEVALGKCNELLDADYKADKMPKGCHSVMGMGRIAPDSADDFTMSDGCVVPLGKPVDTGVVNPKGYTLNYNEFIVYDTAQIKMRYLVKVQFDFK